MKDSSFRKSFGMVTLLFWMGVLWNGCGPRISGYHDGIIDTTEHRLYNGFMFIKMERPDDAQREFERALILNARSSAAHRGMGIVYAMKGDFKSAFASMDLAMSVAEKDEERALARTGMMSLRMMEKGKDWLEMVEENFKHALAFSTHLPEPYFELGLAYKRSFEIQRSKVAFEQVIEINKTLVGEAQEQLLILNKMDKARAKTELGRSILLVDRVTRAQTAALLIAETEIDDLLELVPAGSPESVAPPFRKEGVALPSDVSGHVFEGFIQKALQLRIQGLSIFSDGTFGPDEYMTRAAFAVIIADIISRFREISLFLPTGSRFKDVRPDSPYYKAIMISTEGAKIMDAKGDLFETMGTLSGVDALLCFRKVEKRLKTP
jgi:tetratricopeptide (TPR) repeat protein